MTTARYELLGIVHAVACRVIRHDSKVPLDHVRNFCRRIAKILSEDTNLILRIRNPQDVVRFIELIPQRADAIDEKITELEKLLRHRADYSGVHAKRVLNALIEEECVPMENEAKLLRDYLEGVTPVLTRRSNGVATHATAAKTRLRSLIAFFRDDFGAGNTQDISLDAEARAVAVSLSISHRAFERLFAIQGRGTVLGSKTLIQAIFQNIYQNALRYGGAHNHLRIRTVFSEGTYTSLVKELDYAPERPIDVSTWCRIDISNNGPPIPVEDVNYVFRLGMKYPVEGVEHTESQGLGMTICFAAATLHRGTIFADRELKHGVRFHILLPKDPKLGFNDAQLYAIANKMDIV